MVAVLLPYTAELWVWATADARPIASAAPARRCAGGVGTVPWGAGGCAGAVYGRLSAGCTAAARTA
eukprot:COSAG01_NODE_55102_length_327_cov_0.995614_1_plen_65_part_01